MADNSKNSNNHSCVKLLIEWAQSVWICTDLYRIKNKKRKNTPKKQSILIWFFCYVQRFCIFNTHGVRYRREGGCKIALRRKQCNHKLQYLPLYSVVQHALVCCVLCVCSYTVRRHCPLRHQQPFSTSLFTAAQFLTLIKMNDFVMRTKSVIKLIWNSCGTHTWLVCSAQLNGFFVLSHSLALKVVAVCECIYLAQHSMRLYCVCSMSMCMSV